MPRHDRRRNFHSLSDLEDVLDTIPTLDEDFHSPCPNCEKELVILAGQPIRRVKCGRCNEEYTLDRRIGGELCLLRYNAKEYESDRAFVRRLKAMKFRVLTLVLAFLIVFSIIAAIAYDPSFGFGAVAALIVGLSQVDAGGRDLRKERKQRKKEQRQASRRPAQRDKA